MVLPEGANLNGKLWDSLSESLDDLFSHTADCSAGGGPVWLTPASEADEGQGSRKSGPAGWNERR